jgi:hypothetical protein
VSEEEREEVKDAGAGGESGFEVGEEVKRVV